MICSKSSSAVPPDSTDFHNPLNYRGFRSGRKPRNRENARICLLSRGSLVRVQPGAPFLATYNGATAGDLFAKISKTMPADDPGTLKPRDTVDLLAYVFSANKWPAGATELPTDLAALKQIRIQTKSSR